MAKSVSCWQDHVSSSEATAATEQAKGSRWTCPGADTHLVWVPQCLHPTLLLPSLPWASTQCEEPIGTRPGSGRKAEPFGGQASLGFFRKQKPEGMWVLRT